MTIDLTVLNDLATVFFLLSGLFFLAVTGLGLYRMPDFYHRMHAATHGATLGLMGLLLAALFYFPTHMACAPAVIAAKVVLAITFQFLANPVGGHMLAKAAHLDGCPKWEHTRFDELE